ncbi:expressed unknown protein [Seminavis robusta]|uniref:Uncharacterized protein n=1 Tax=Seminavis robusta TaxID=568900 RepID=A0A9N8HGG7_9STRA|nr:expressed unknown protein [Seminavis robusta]|eukprot:Sro577_g169620.1 n/a (193) ;mRNA; r:8830-9408
MVQPQKAHAGNNIKVVKRTKPRRQSGEAVKGIQQGSSCLAAHRIENCDQDLQRMRRNSPQSVLQDLEAIFHVSSVQHEIAHLLARPRSAFGEESATFLVEDDNDDSRKDDEDLIVVMDMEDEEKEDVVAEGPSRAKRSKARRQSGETVSKFLTKNKESIRFAKTVNSIELCDPDTTQRRRSCRKRILRQASE